MRHTLIFGPSTLSRMRIMGLRVSVSTALTLSAAVFGHFYPGEAEPTASALNRPATVNASLNFDFSDLAPKREPAPVAVAAEAEAPIPLPKARPTAPSGGKLGNVAATLPKGVERFDRCQTACDSRDPVILASWSPAAAPAPAPVAARPAAASVSLLPPAPMAPPVPAKPGMLEGAVDGAMALAGSGKRMLDGAVTGAGATFTSVKSTVLGAITLGN